MASSFAQFTLYIIIVLILGITSILNTADAGSLSRRRSNLPYIVNRWDHQIDSRGSPFDPCDSKEGSVSALHVSNCSDTDDKCILRGGTDVTIAIDFVSKVNAKTLNTAVFGIVGGIPIPFHVPQSNACQNSGVECPLQSGTTYHYSTTLPVLSSYPKMSVKVKWELKTETGVVACVIIPAAIE